jgi:hypothetical protein
VAQVQLEEDAADVGLHRRLADHERGGDLGGDFAFAVGLVPAGVDGPGGLAWLVGLLWLTATSIVLARRPAAVPAVRASAVTA